MGIEKLKTSWKCLIVEGNDENLGRGGGGGVIEHICGTFYPVVLIVIGGNSVHLSQNCSKVAGPRMKQMEI